MVPRQRMFLTLTSMSESRKALPECRKALGRAMPLCKTELPEVNSILSLFWWLSLSFLTFTKNNLWENRHSYHILLICLISVVCVCWCQRTTFKSPCGSQGLNSGHQDWQQMLLSAEHTARSIVLWKQFCYFLLGSLPAWWVPGWNYCLALCIKIKMYFSKAWMGIPSVCTVASLSSLFGILKQWPSTSLSLLPALGCLATSLCVFHAS